MDMSFLDSMSLGVLFFILMLGQVLFVLPCWILAERKKVAPAWWHWVIPFWNLLVAYKVGNGSLKLLIFALIATISAVVMIPFVILNPLGIVIVLAIGLLGYGLNLYAMYLWSKNMSVLASVSPYVLAGILIVMPTVVPILGYGLLFLGTITLPAVTAMSYASSSLAWLAFMVIALRAPKGTPNIPVTAQHA